MIFLIGKVGICFIQQELQARNDFLFYFALLIILIDGKLIGFFFTIENKLLVTNA